jgi:hypothetical protein
MRSRYYHRWWLFRISKVETPWPYRFVGVLQVCSTCTRYFTIRLGRYELSIRISRYGAEVGGPRKSVTHL